MDPLLLLQPWASHGTSGSFQGLPPCGLEISTKRQALTPCPTCYSCWLSKFPLIDTVWSRLLNHFTIAPSFDPKTYSHLKAFASAFPSAWLLFPLLSTWLFTHLSGLSSEVVSSERSLTTLGRATCEAPLRLPVHFHPCTVCKMISLYVSTCLLSVSLY